MNAGRFDELIELWTYSVTTSPYGEPLKQWTKLTDLWASIKYTNGREAFTAEQREHQQIVEFTIRYNSTVSVYDQIKHEGSTYKIISISEVARRMYLTLHCERSS